MPWSFIRCSAMFERYLQVSSTDTLEVVALIRPDSDDTSFSSER